MTELVSPADARKALGISNQTLGKYLEAGLIDGVTLPSGHRRYTRESIERIIRTKVSPTVVRIDQLADL
jgi:predicted site-specific integrase-resolvase